MLTVSDTLPAVELGDIVRVKNSGKQTYKIMYDSREYALAPGVDAFIPFEAAKLWFGDPRASNSMQSIRNQHGQVAWVPDRDTEVRRLRVKYGCIGGDEREIQGAPTVEIYELATGSRIYSVLDDPAGERSTPAVQTVNEQAQLLAIVERQQAQIQYLMDQIPGIQNRLPSTEETLDADDTTFAVIDGGGSDDGDFDPDAEPDDDTDDDDDNPPDTDADEDDVPEDV